MNSFDNICKWRAIYLRKVPFRQFKNIEYMDDDGVSKVYDGSYKVYNGMTKDFTALWFNDDVDIMGSKGVILKNVGNYENLRYK
ncbi:6651_t:CDS:1, partial [Funneliformis caledonium]